MATKNLWLIDKPPLDQRLVVVHSGNFLDIYNQYYGGSFGKLQLLVHSNLRIENLLKFVEDYEDDLEVFVLGFVTLTFISRFTRVENLRKYQLQDIKIESENQILLNEIKKYCK